MARGRSALCGLCAVAVLAIGSSVGWSALPGRIAAAGAQPAPSGCATYSSPGTGSHQVCGAILAKYRSLGGPASFLGYPTTDELPTPDGIGRFNHFVNDGSIYWTAKTGAWSIHGAIQDKWASLGWERSFLGYPVTDETGTPDGIGRFNHFVNDGSIYWTTGTGARSVHGAIQDKWASSGWERSCQGYPVSDEFAIPNGRQSNFQNGVITFNSSSGVATSNCRAACTAPGPSSIATRLSADIWPAMLASSDTIAVAVYDRTTGVTCAVNPHLHFDAASTVKVTILGTLLRMVEQEHRALTAQEDQLARAMIQHSDNNAASALWAEVGVGRFQQFLNLVGMTETIPGPGPYWGLTRETAGDEMKLMLMLRSNSTTALTAADRAYELKLMTEVDADEQWGVTAGAPAGVTISLKTGNLPRATRGQRVHAIGDLYGAGRDYAIVLLSDNNPTLAYGVTSLDTVGQVINRDLNPTNTGAVRPATQAFPPDIPDEQIPDLPNVP